MILFYFIKTLFYFFNMISFALVIFFSLLGLDLLLLLGLGLLLLLGFSTKISFL
jgi:hypothetical protein